MATNNVKIGDSNIAKICIGDANISQVYLGNNLIFSTSEDPYYGYDLVLHISGSNTSYGDAFYRVTFPNKLDESLEYIDSFTYGAYTGRNFEGIVKLKNVKYYGNTQTKTSGIGSIYPNYKILKVSAPSTATDLSYLCYEISDDTDISFLRTDNATNMEHMFGHATVTSLDLTAFKTNNVTTMENMFNSCTSLTSLDLSNFNTSKVTSMVRTFENCSSLTSLDLSNFDTSNVTDYNRIFGNVKDCTIYIGENWTWGTYSTFGSGSNLTFIRPIKSITLKSSLADGIVHRGDKFTITPNIIPSNYLDDLVITYDSNYLSRNGYTFTVLNTAIIGQETTITYSSKNNPSISATYVVNVQAKLITNITLESTLTDTAILKGTQFTITPTIMPTDYSGDELVITYDENYLSMVDNTFTVLDTATIGQQLDITYSSKNNPSVSTTYSVTIRDFAHIELIELAHTLETLTDVAIDTTFTVVPTVEPLSYDDELLVDYDTSYLSKDGDNYTVLDGASGQTVQVIYYSKHDNNVNAILEFTVAEKVEPIVINLQSTAPKLPDYLTLDYNDTYYFKNSVYGLYPSANPDIHKNKLNYSRYKFIAPRNGVLKFNYKYSSSAAYYFSINVTEDVTCPSYSQGNALLCYNRLSNIEATSNGLEIIGGTTYYIHFQLRTTSVYSDGTGRIKTIIIE